MKLFCFCLSNCYTLYNFIDYMKYIHATQGSIYAFFVFVLLSFGVGFIDRINRSEMELILTISTFIFAILAGFFISRLNSRFNHVRELVATEDALWQSFLRTAPIFGKAFVKKIITIIDRYYIISFDHELGEYYKHNAACVNQMYKELEHVKIAKTNSKADNTFDNMIAFLAQIEDARNKTAVITDGKLTNGQWGVLYILVSVVIYSIFYLQGLSIYSRIIAVLLSTTLVLVLLIMRDLQNFRLGGKILVDESGQEIFEYIGKPRYYNKKYLDEGTEKVPESVHTYRLGLHEPGEKPRIELVKNGN